jgi:hypothetical protein
MALYEAKRQGRNLVVGYKTEYDRLHKIQVDHTKKRKTA